MEIARGSGELAQRTGDAVAGPEHGQEHDDIEDERLRQQLPDQGTLRAWPGRTEREPAPAGKLDRDHQLGAHAAKAFGAGGVHALQERAAAVDRADHGDDLADGDAAIGKPAAKVALDVAAAGELGGDRVGRAEIDAPAQLAASLVPVMPAAAIGHARRVRARVHRRAEPLGGVDQPGDGGDDHLGEARVLALADEETEIDRLGDEQRDRDEQRDLAGKRAGKEANAPDQSRVTSAASV